MGDLISRQAAIDAISTWPKYGADNRNRIVPWHEGLVPYVHLEDVVKAIVGLPSAQPEWKTENADVPDMNVGDMISRQEAIDAFDEIESEVAEGEGFRYEKWRRFFAELPSVQPDLSGYSDKLWKAAFERGKEEGQLEQRWIPVMDGEGQMPEVDDEGYSEKILLSFANFSLLAIGEYRVNSEGGVFYDGDDDKPLTHYGLFVNAWQPLPEPYREEGDRL